MKNAIKLFGIIALVAVIGFSMVSCGGDDDSGGGGGTITITGTPKVGQKLTATSSGGNFEGDFVWVHADTSDGSGFHGWQFILTSETSGVNENEFTLNASYYDGLVGMYIQARRQSGTDMIESNVLGPVAP